MVGQILGLGDVVTDAEQDQALFEAWKAGDAGAYNRLAGRLERVAKRAARGHAHRSDADDVLSEALLGVCEAIQTWTREWPLGLVAFYKARGRVSEYVRRVDRHRTISIYAYSSTECITEWRSDGNQEHAALVAEVQAVASDILPPKELDVLLLRAVGMSGAAIARRKRVDRSQICRRERAAMGKLSDALREDD